MTISEKTNITWHNSPQAISIFKFFGSCCYIGCMKKQNGIWNYLPDILGSLPGLLLFLFTKELAIGFQTLVLFVFTLISVAITYKLEECDSIRGSVEVVIDKSLGMWISLFALWDANFSVVASAFILYNLLNILRPYPISIFQTLKNGIGTNADDFASGMVTNIIIRYLLLKSVF